MLTISAALRIIVFLAILREELATFLALRPPPSEQQYSIPVENHVKRLVSFEFSDFAKILPPRDSLIAKEIASCIVEDYIVGFTQGLWKTTETVSVKQFLLIDPAMNDHCQVRVWGNHIYGLLQRFAMLTHKVVTVMVSPEGPGLVPEIHGNRQGTVSQIEGKCHYTHPAE